MLSGDSGQGDSLSTPRSVSKRLFSVSASTSKRNLFSDSPCVSGGERGLLLSGDESDLGPMSPLALTDGNESSSGESSPGRNFVSPFTTPEKSPEVLKSWDRLRLPSTKNRPNSSLSPFSALRMSTKAARSSPNRRIFGNSPKSLPLKSRREFTHIPGTPERQVALLFGEVIPETPQKESSDEFDRIEETPDKNETQERRLTTPLSSLRENIAPKLNRRKSVTTMDKEETSSPERKENSLKRYASDCLVSGSKFPKTDEISTIPKARASLFPEKKANSPISDIKLSAKSFYKSAGKRGRSMCDLKDFQVMTKRHSLPIYNNEKKFHHRSAKKTRFGEMNAGVRHGIKRPKPKKHVSRIEAFKKEEKPKVNEKPDIEKVEKERVSAVPVEPRGPSPVADPNKRFFKTNRTIKTHRFATVTVNDKIKLKVSDGKIALNEMARKNPRKRPRLEEISFNADDLTVDEPGFDTSISKRNVDGILKVLEDDWADDDYDTMEILTGISPTRNVAESVKNVLMSPASVLSDMTSSMNIKDNRIHSGFIDGNGNEQGDKKMFPVFSKGYSSGMAEEPLGKKTPRGVKRSWQTSLKSGCGGAENQYQIDAGQKRFGATTCNECGIVYQLGEPEDENAHLNYHNSYKTLKFNGWKNERVIMSDPFTNSRIIMIEPSDPKQYWKKVEEVLDVVDKDLGLAEMELSNYLDKKIYFYVREKTILAVMVAESIKKAHRMIPELMELDCCSDEETPAMCGVNVIWTAMSNRRQHIATKLLDTLRATFFYGYIMSIDDIAFSIPTPSGKIFAEKYTKTRSFKVYS